jgi:hypothetical protein
MVSYWIASFCSGTYEWNCGKGAAIYSIDTSFWMFLGGLRSGGATDLRPAPRISSDETKVTLVQSVVYITLICIPATKGVMTIMKIQGELAIYGDLTEKQGRNVWILSTQRLAITPTV